MLGSDVQLVKHNPSKHVGAWWENNPQARNGFSQVQGKPLLSSRVTTNADAKLECQSRHKYFLVLDHKTTMFLYHLSWCLFCQFLLLWKDITVQATLTMLRCHTNSMLRTNTVEAFVNLTEVNGGTNCIPNFPCGAHTEQLMLARTATSGWPPAASI